MSPLSTALPSPIGKANSKSGTMNRGGAHRRTTESPSTSKLFHNLLALHQVPDEVRAWSNMLHGSQRYLSPRRHH